MKRYTPDTHPKHTPETHTHTHTHTPQGDADPTDDAEMTQQAMGRMGSMM
jgi:hypothetical protein